MNIPKKQWLATKYNLWTPFDFTKIMWSPQFLCTHCYLTKTTYANPRGSDLWRGLFPVRIIWDGEEMWMATLLKQWRQMLCNCGVSQKILKTKKELYCFFSIFSLSYIIFSLFLNCLYLIIYLFTDLLEMYKQLDFF